MENKSEIIKSLEKEIKELDSQLVKGNFYPRVGVMPAMIGGEAKKLHDKNQKIWESKKELEIELKNIKIENEIEQLRNYIKELKDFHLKTKKGKTVIKMYDELILLSENASEQDKIMDRLKTNEKETWEMVNKCYSIHRNYKESLKRDLGIVL